MHSLSRCHIIILFFLCGMLANFSASAQGTFTVQYDDSLVTTETSSVLYNKIKVTNTGNQALDVKGLVSLPAGWKNLYSNDVQLSIAPGQTEQILINLISAKNTLSVWQPVTVRLWTTDSANAKKYSYLVKTYPKPQFTVQKLEDDLYFDEYPKEIKLGTYIKNTGNVADVYILHYNNKYFLLDNTVTIKLAPGKDTTIFYPVRVSKRAWRAVMSENIFLGVEASGRRSSVMYEVSRPQNSLKENRSAYQSIPLTLDAGVFAIGNKLFYYGGGRTQLQFADHSLGLYYRSRQMSNQTDNFLQRDVFTVNYRYKQFILKAGTFGTSYNYLSMGNSLSLGYIGKNKSFVVSGTRPFRNSILMRGDNVNAVGEYKLGKVKMRHIAEGNFDKRSDLNGYILDNSAKILDIQNTDNSLALSANVGVSLEEKTNATLAPNVNREELGYSAGYNFSFDNKKFGLYSYVDHHSAHFPGIRKGMSVQQHSVKRKMKGNSYVGAMYSYSVMKRNFFRDSIYNSDVLSYNNSRYGLTYGRSGKKNSFNLAAGLLQQQGQFAANALNKYYFLEINENYNLNDKSRLLLSSLSGISTRPFENKKRLWITSNSLDLNYHFVGVTGMYVRNVMIAPENNTPEYSETVNGGPYVTFNFFGMKLTGTVRYNIAKAIQDDRIRHGVGANLAYNNRNTGTRIMFNGYMPFRTVSNYRVPFTEMKYGFLNISQQIHIPIKQKYYDLKVVIYDDVNNNNLKDPEEPYLRDVPIDIGEKTLYTNNDGEIEYRNIKTGNYNVSVYKAYGNEGLIPANGPQQIVNIGEKSAVVNMPFKKGRVISGTVKITQDALNTTQMSNQYIKVNAGDSMGRKYTTLTDEDGAFYLYVPDGLFTVSLEHTDFGNGIKAVKPSYQVSIAENENAFVCFELLQKKRKVRFLSQTPSTPETPKTDTPNQPQQPVAATDAPINHAAKRHQ